MLTCRRVILDLNVVLDARYTSNISVFSSAGFTNKTSIFYIKKKVFRVGRYSKRFSAHDKNLGSQNYSESYIEFDNVIYALELGASKIRRFRG